MSKWVSFLFVEAIPSSGSLYLMSEIAHYLHCKEVHVIIYEAKRMHFARTCVSIITFNFFQSNCGGHLGEAISFTGKGSF